MSKEGEPTQLFQGLAEIYSRNPYREVSIKRARYIRDVWQQNDFCPTRILDLGCGSGVGSGVFLEPGVKVVGIDISEKMLRAGLELVQNSSGLKLVCADVKALPFIENSFDGVVSIFDALNYLGKNDLHKLFKDIKELSRSGAYLSLDFLTKRAFDDMGMHPDSIYEDDDFYYLSKASAEGEKINLKLIAFIKEQDEQYRRIEENHTLTLFDEQDLTCQLEKTGFVVEEIYDGEEFKKVDQNSWHAIIFARNIK